jgi:hypothetical protein
LALARAHGGRIYPSFPHSLLLLIDVKSDAEPTYRALSSLLARYHDLLTVFTDGRAREGAVTAVISGERTLETMQRDRVRYAGYDGRADDLGSASPAALIPLLSHHWAERFTWRGRGPMPQDERVALRKFTRAAHEHGQRVRFWATPEEPAQREAVWRELLASDVDYINSDDLAGLAAYLRKYDQHSGVPAVARIGALWRVSRP